MFCGFFLMPPFYRGFSSHFSVGFFVPFVVNFCALFLTIHTFFVVLGGFPVVLALFLFSVGFFVDFLFFLLPWCWNFTSSFLTLTSVGFFCCFYCF